jgi:hypothetical protein
MNKIKVLFVVLALSLPMFVSVAEAQVKSTRFDRFEFGVLGGVGFYQSHVHDNTRFGDGIFRIQGYDAVTFNNNGLATLNVPGIETFGGSVGYRFNTMWNLRLSATRQRVNFAEYHTYIDTKLDRNETHRTRFIYYNAMWHVDAMAEYNILPYGLRTIGSGNIYNFTPFLGVGAGVTMFNEQASLRKIYEYNGPLDRNKTGNPDGKIYTSFPRVGYKQVYADGDTVPSWQKAEMAYALYIPFALGLKWRLNPHFQLKAAFQYNMYISIGDGKLGNTNLDGGALAVSDYDHITKSVLLPEGEYYKPRYGGNLRPTFDELPHDRAVANNHNCMFTVSLIVNFAEWYEDRVIKY